MQKKDRILSEITRVARQMFSGGGDGRVYLYGSQARNEANKNSDWDLLIIIDDKLSSTDDFSKFAFPFAEIGWRFGEQITPIHFTKTQWEAQRNTAFFNNVTSEAIRL
ncbi:MAG: nucleotidyltransferase domain-containing protein [Muribaculum sp.]|nr:nucleotidyltransferase domain-containing protein [Muribaculum sp.]